MTDDVREISVIVRGTNAEQGLRKIAGQLDNLGTAVGASDAQLRKFDRTINNAFDQVVKAASTISQLKNRINELSQANTKAVTETGRLSNKLITANKEIARMREVISNQRTVVSDMVRYNLQLANSLDKVTGSAARASTATQSMKPLTVHPDAIAAQGRAAVGLGAPLTLVDKTSSSSLKTLNHGLLDGISNANALRYQLYDVAATFGILGAAAVVAGTQVFRVGIDWDKNFANVVRTSQVTGYAVNWLKESFLQLQSAIPVNSADLATIATLGAQMGVAAANLNNFTEITAKFSATSGTSVDEAATALSRLDQLLPDVAGNYERLASTILRTGVNAVATEQQIIRGTGQIAAIGRIAGLTTPEIVGLASALSSLGFSPELQRSVITSSFSKILTATSQVTAQTEKFGAVLNITGKQFQQAWREDAVGTYRDLLKAIASRGDAVTVLQDLGLASQRLTPNLLKLGQNTEVLNKALGDTRSEWQINGELSRQYGIIADTVAARIQILGQTWEALLVTLDGSDTIIKPLVDGLTGVLKIIRNLAKMPGVSTMVSLAAAITVLAGVTALGAAGLAAMSAGYIAITFAQKTLMAQTIANTGVEEANTAATLRNTGARGLNVGATIAGTGALEAQNVALGANAVGSAAAGNGLLSFTGKAITALPAILRLTGIIGIATAAIAGLVAIVASSPDIGLDIQKWVKGIQAGTEQELKFDTDKLNAAVAAINTGDFKSALDTYTKKMQQAAEAHDFGTVLGDAFFQSQTGGGASGLALKDFTEDPQIDLEAINRDIFDHVMALGTVEDKYAAVNYISKQLGVTQEDLLTNIMPDLGSALGSVAASASEAQDEMLKLESAQSLWAASLGTTDENLASLRDGIQSAAGDFLDFGDALARAYDTSGDEGTGGGLEAFLGSMQSQIGSFESFYGNLGKLVQNGGVQLAGFFAEQGPSAAQALTDSLALTPEQIGQIESNMSLAAFYASEEFANTFSQNNSLLAEVWRQSGNNPDAVAAFNDALQASMKGGSIDPTVLAKLAAQFGIEIPVGMIPDIDPDVFDTATALVGAKITPVKVPIQVDVPGTGETTTTEVDAWIVEMEGHKVTIPVDPNTAEGAAILQRWRDNEYRLPVNLQARADYYNATLDIQRFRDEQAGRVLWIQARVTATGGGWAGVDTAVATGGLQRNGKIVRDNYPRYARGSNGIIRGRGSGTSDDILSWLSNGEAVTNARAVRHYGTRMMEDINKMRFPKFAAGGFAGGTPQFASSGSGTVVTATVIQNYPTTRDPIKTMKQDAEAVVAGIWT